MIVLDVLIYRLYTLLPDKAFNRDGIVLTFFPIFTLLNLGIVLAICQVPFGEEKIRYPILAGGLLLAFILWIAYFKRGRIDYVLKKFQGRSLVFKIFSFALFGIYFMLPVIIIQAKWIFDMITVKS